MVREWLRSLARPVYFWLFRLRGYPGVEYHRGKIVEIVHEYDRVFSYRISRPEGLNYHAGQYLHLVAPGGYINPQDVRHMSFASAPDESDLLFTMDLASDTRFKRRFAAANIGDQVGLYTVRGQFTLGSLPTDTSVLFIAGGVGITPIRSLIRSQPGQRWALIYAGRGYCYAREWEHDSRGARIELVDRHELFAVLDTVVDDFAFFYLCGSARFLDAVVGHLIARDVDKNRIRTENFSE